MIALEKGKTALLVMDLQADIVTRLGDKAAPLVERTAGLVAAARKAALPIVYVVVGFRAGYPEVSPRNQWFATVKGSGRFVMSAPPGSDIVPAVAPQAGDVVVVKHRVGAFSGTDLDMILRAQSIDTLLFAGISTSGVILSTVRHAADADYRLVVVEDCCGDADDEVHRVLTQKVLVRQATVVPASDVIGAL